MVSKKTKILLIEDDLFHRSLLAEGLEDYYGYDISKAENIESAIERLKTLTPDLIVLDCVFGKDRFKAIDWATDLRCRPEFSNIPILFVTAYYKEMQERVQQIEKSRILEKPFTFEEVTQKMRELLVASNG